MDFETILFEIEDRVAVMTLNRPEVLNSLNNQLMDDMRVAIRIVERSAEARVLVITGSGRGFCSGADLAGSDVSAAPEPGHMTVGDRVARSMADYHNDLILEIARLEKPVVAAVNGVTAGGGVGLALAADMVIAARSAYFVQVFGPKLGIVPDMGTTWFVPHKIGHARAMGLAMLGERLPAETAADWGLIWKCVEDERLMAEAMEIARKLADAPPKLFGFLKRAFYKSETNSLEEQLELERETQRMLCATDDFLEGVTAFLQKRKPDFKGR